MEFDNKNIIIGYSKHIFTNLYINTLVSKCDIDENDICLIALDDIVDDSLLSGINIQTFDHTLCSLEDLNKCKTITLISLGSCNSSFIRKIFEYSNDLIKKTFIHLTDDELARWVKTKNKFGKLIVTKNNNVDNDCMYVLDKVNNFIASDKPFRSGLEFVLERENFKLFDGRDAFKTMPTALWDKFTELYECDTQHTQAENRILIGAKRGAFSLSETIAILHYLKNEGVLPDFKCMVYTEKKRKLFRICIDLYLSYLKYIKKCNVDVSFPTPTNNITYNALIMSCSHLILQGRGSMTTARSFLVMGRGVVHVAKGSPNDIELTQSEGVDVAGYKDFRELALNAKNNLINIDDNTLKMKNRYRLKYDVLGNIYK